MRRGCNRKPLNPEGRQRLGELPAAGPSSPIGGEDTRPCHSRRPLAKTELSRDRRRRFSLTHAAKGTSFLLAKTVGDAGAKGRPVSVGNRTIAPADACCRPTPGACMEKILLPPHLRHSRPALGFRQRCPQCFIGERGDGHEHFLSQRGAATSKSATPRWRR